MIIKLKPIASLYLLQTEHRPLSHLSGYGRFPSLNGENTRDKQCWMRKIPRSVWALVFMSLSLITYPILNLNQCRSDLNNLDKANKQ